MRIIRTYVCFVFQQSFCNASSRLSSTISFRFWWSSVIVALCPLMRAFSLINSTNFLPSLGLTIVKAFGDISPTLLSLIYRYLLRRRSTISGSSLIHRILHQTWLLRVFILRQSSGCLIECKLIATNIVGNGQTCIGFIQLYPILWSWVNRWRVLIRSPRFSINWMIWKPWLGLYDLRYLLGVLLKLKATLAYSGTIWRYP